jgi:uncharacterized membrane protein YgcG
VIISIDQSKFIQSTKINKDMKYLHYSTLAVLLLVSIQAADPNDSITPTTIVDPQEAQTSWSIWWLILLCWVVLSIVFYYMTGFLLIYKVLGWLGFTWHRKRKEHKQRKTLRRMESRSKELNGDASPQLVSSGSGSSASSSGSSEGSSSLGEEWHEAKEA